MTDTQPTATAAKFHSDFIKERVKAESTLHGRGIHLLTRDATDVEKIKNIALFIFKAAVCAFLYWTNPYLFWLGVIVGIVKDEETQKTIGKIHAIWQTHPISASALSGLALLSLPATMVTGTLLSAANLGSGLSLQAQQLVNATADGKPGMLPASASG